MHTFDVIIRPISTEKVTDQAGMGKYSFQVHKRANKLQIKQAVEAAYKVKVVDVNVINMPGKPRRVATRRVRHEFTSPTWKKAIVTLVEGQSITLFEGV
jgi:large subunit ribosomal protein L23